MKIVLEGGAVSKNGCRALSKNKIDTEKCVQNMAKMYHPDTNKVRGATLCGGGGIAMVSTGDADLRVFVGTGWGTHFAIFHYY